MLNINGILLDTTVLDILTALKSYLAMQGISLLSDIKPTGDNIMITCPSHKGGQERKPSCGVHIESGVVHCFTCGYTATLPEFIGFCCGQQKETAYIYGASWLKANFIEWDVNERSPIELDFNRNHLPHDLRTFVPDMVLAQYRFVHPYMYKRKLTDKVIEQFDIGYDKETDCITFPVRDVHGNCLFVARRSVKGKWFNYPSGAEKPLYGIYEWFKAGSPKEICVCESMFNCLTCWVHGIPALALNGTGSNFQLAELSRLPVRSLVLCLDPDDAGRKGAKRISGAVKNKLLYSVNYPDTRDLNDLDDEEFDSVMATKHLFTVGC